MKLPKSRYDMIDAISKFVGLVLLAMSVDNASKGNYYIALFLFGLGGIIGVIPLFIEVKALA